MIFTALTRRTGPVVPKPGRQVLTKEKYIYNGMCVGYHTASIIYIRAEFLSGKTSAPGLLEHLQEKESRTVQPLFSPKA